MFEGVLLPRGYVIVSEGVRTCLTARKPGPCNACWCPVFNGVQHVQRVQQECMGLWGIVKRGKLFGNAAASRGTLPEHASHTLEEAAARRPSSHVTEENDGKCRCSCRY